MDENGKKFLLTLIGTLAVLACVFLFIAFVMLISGGILGPDTSPAESPSVKQRG